MKEKGKITNSDYQVLNDVSRETLTRDLKELVDKNILRPSGQKGAEAFYMLNELHQVNATKAMQMTIDALFQNPGT